MSAETSVEDFEFSLSSEDNLSYTRYERPISKNFVRDHQVVSTAAFPELVQTTPPREEIYAQQDAILQRVTEPKPPPTVTATAPSSSSSSPPASSSSSSPSSPSPSPSSPSPLASSSPGSAAVVTASGLTLSGYGSEPAAAPAPALTLSMTLTGYGSPTPATPTPAPSFSFPSLHAPGGGLPPSPAVTLTTSGTVLTGYATPPSFGDAPSTTTPVPAREEVSSTATPGGMTLSGYVSQTSPTRESATPSGYVPAPTPVGYGTAPPLSSSFTSSSSSPSSSSFSSPSSPSSSFSSLPSSSSSLHPPETESKGYLSQLLNVAPKDRDEDRHSLHRRDWNGDFQSALEELRGLTPNTRHEDRVKVYQTLSRLSEDFVYTVKTYGRIIISEEALDVSEKTLKPVSVGGIAGGTKYIEQGILFKFALDTNGLYSSDHNAQKVAGHELKALTHLFNCWERALCFPMMAICDYRGFRLIGMTILPIRGSSTLVFGSADAGTTLCSQSQVATILESVGKKLNLRAHAVGGPMSTLKYYTPLDLEVHRGTDGRFYAVDLARLFPPQSPGVLPISSGHSYLFRLLRPEFVKKWPKALSADAFSNFGRAPPGSTRARQEESRECDRDVDEATRVLLEREIPSKARMLTNNTFQIDRNQVMQQMQLYLHAAGINLRFLGLLYAEVRKIGDERWRIVILFEMVSRVIKDMINELLRTEVRRLKTPGEAAYCRAVVSRLNIIFGTSEESSKFWADTIEPALVAKYNIHEDEALQLRGPEGGNLKQHIITTTQGIGFGDGRCFLMFRVSQLLGLQFIRKTWKYLTKTSSLYDYVQPLHETDLLEMREKVSYMNIAAHSQGFVLKLLAVNALDLKEKRRLLERAKTYFQTALIPNPDNKVTLRNLADCYMECNEDFEAMKCFQYALHSDGKDTNTLMKAATLFDKVGKINSAESLYLRSLEASPNHSNCLALYADFLWIVHKEPDRAELFYRAAIKADPRNSSAVNNFAVFLILERGQIHHPEVLSLWRKLYSLSLMFPVQIKNIIKYLEISRPEEGSSSDLSPEFLLRRLSSLRSRRSTVLN